MLKIGSFLTIDLIYEQLYIKYINSVKLKIINGVKYLVIMCKILKTFNLVEQNNESVEFS